MLFFFDDSGDFSLPEGHSHKVSLWSGVAIPETILSEIESSYKAWEVTLSTNEKLRTEVKGSRLSMESRRQFFKMLSAKAGLLFHPTIIDLEAQKRLFGSKEITEIAKNIGVQRSASVLHKSIKEETGLQAKQIGNLSEQQLLKVISLGHSIWQTVRFAIRFRSNDENRSCWNNVELWIDRSSKSNSREEQILRTSLGWYLFNSTKNDPFILVKEIHNKTHPFVKNFRTKRGINTRKLFRDSIKFADSKQHIGLSIADIFANTLYLVLNDLNNTKGHLEFYKDVMAFSELTPASSLGILLIDLEENVSREGEQKYSILRRILESSS